MRDPWADEEDASPEGAILSTCTKYRYRLWRRWHEGPTGLAVFLMLNPSTADAKANDPTIRKCIGFAQRWGFDGIRVVNLFAYRATKPAALNLVADPVGPQNDLHLHYVLTAQNQRVIFAWGSAGGNSTVRATARARGRLFASKMSDVGATPLALTFAKDGAPRHPLMLAYTTELERYR